MSSNASTWELVLHDNFPGIKTLNSQADSARWKKQISMLMQTTSVTDEMITTGIKWALLHVVRPDHYYVPGPQDIVAWIRRAKHDESEKAMHREREQREYRRLTEPERKAVVTALSSFNKTFFHPAHVTNSISGGYIMLAAGDAIEAEDEYWDGAAWVRYGVSRPRRFVKYADAWARRKANAGDTTEENDHDSSRTN